MNLSTFNSKKFITLFLSMLTSLMLIEVAMRIFEQHLSLDLLHIYQLDEISEHLRQAENTRVLLLGNSIIREGIKKNILEKVLNQKYGLSTTVASAYPDDTTIVEWLYLYKHYFLDYKAVPDLLVLAVVSHSLDDSGSSQPTRLGGFYTDWGDMPFAFQNDLTSFGERSEFVLAKFSSAFRDRNRVQLRVLALIPGYNKFSNQINEGLIQKTNDSHAGNQVPRTFRRLVRLIQMAAAHNTRMAMVLMPIQPPRRHEIDVQELAVLQAYGVKIIDMRDLPWIEAEHFRDSIHLTEEGGSRLTQDLAPHIAEILNGID